MFTTLLPSTPTLPITLPPSIFKKFGIVFTTALYLTRGLMSSLQYTYYPQPTPVIYTPDGALQGKLGISRDGLEYWQFLGIPYAEPPEGALRFQPPVPVKKWGDGGGGGIKQVMKWPPACIQFDPIFVVRSIGVENCLFLNLFVTPTAIQERQKVPVLVYFHGGAFLEGESTFYYPTFIMDYGPIVVVTCHYRLGPLGFLNFEEQDPKYPRGNMGLKDQNLVLRWVQRNVEYFGGDPSRVTIMGDSAGAASVNFHVASPMSKGLFQRAIAISGSSLCPWAFTQKSRNIAEKYASRLGCEMKSNSSEELLSCYQIVEANDLVKLQWSWADPSLEKDEFVPTVETVQGNDTFLGERPIRILESGRANYVPFMMGVTSGEGSLRSARFERRPELIPKLDKDWDKMIGRMMFFDEDPISPQMARKIRSFYFSRDFSRRADRKTALRLLTILNSDALFYEPVHSSAVNHAKMGAPTYLFYYDYRSKLIPGSYSFYRAVRLSDGVFSLVRLLQGLAGDWFREKLLGAEQRQRQIYSVGHAENALQVWDAFGISGSVANGDREFSEEFVKTLVDFVKGREPTFRRVKWPNLVDARNTSKVPFMLMDRDGQGRVISEPFADRMKFWEQLAPFRADRR